MSNVMIKKTGTGFEVSNGTYTLLGPNRADLLKAMDALENQPAAVEKIQEKVEKAAVKVQEKIEAKDQPKKKVKRVKVSGMQRVREFMNSTRSKVTAAEVAQACDISQKYANNYLWALWKKGEIKSTVKGVYYK